MNAMRIEDFSDSSLQYIFVNHIPWEAKVITDKWRGYGPIDKACNITQIESNGGMNYKALHPMVHQVKSGIKLTYSWVSNFNINRYCNEFCFKINQSQSKNSQ
jgi:hypothetical protein